MATHAVSTHGRIVPRHQRGGRGTTTRPTRSLPKPHAVSDPANADAALASHLKPPLEHFNPDFVGTERSYDKKLEEVKEAGTAVEVWEEGALEVAVRAAEVRVAAETA